MTACRRSSSVISSVHSATARTISGRARRRIHGAEQTRPVECCHVGQPFGCCFIHCPRQIAGVGVSAGLRHDEETIITSSKTFADLGVSDDIVAALADHQHHQPVPDPGARHPAGAQGPRPHRPGPHRHRQDAGVHRPDPAEDRRARATAGSRRRSSSCRPASSRVQVDQRRQDGRRQARGARPDRLRRPCLRAAAGGAEEGRRHRRRHPRPAARPGRAARARPVRGQGARARRGRRDARPRLPARRRAHRVAGARPSGRPCCSPRRCPGPVITLARRYLDHPTHVRAESPRRERDRPDDRQQFVFRTHHDRQARGARPRPAGRRPRPDDGLHPHQAHRRPGRRRPRPSAASPPPPCTATSARAPASRRCGRSAAGKIDVLVATDVAARGIDIAGVTHVVNYQCPEDEKTYLHRIGRTGRAGETGIAVTFVDWDDVLPLGDDQQGPRPAVPGAARRPTRPPTHLYDRARHPDARSPARCRAPSAPAQASRPRDRGPRRDRQAPAAPRRSRTGRKTGARGRRRQCPLASERRTVPAERTRRAKTAEADRSDACRRRRRQRGTPATAGAAYPRRLRRAEPGSTCAKRPDTRLPHQDGCRRTPICY